MNHPPRKSQRPKKHERCVFCGATGKLTREHIIAEWVQKHIPARWSGTLHAVSATTAVEWRGDRLVNVIEGGPGTLNRPGDLLSKRLEIVCANCNGGWMSRLQKRAAPLLTPLFKGEWSAAIDSVDRNTLATWCVVTTMVDEFAHEETRMTPDAERFHVREQLTPPSTWTVWLGRFFGPGWNNAFNHIVAQSALIDEETRVVVPDDGYEQTTAFGLGGLFIQTHSTNLAVGLDASAFAARFGLNLLWPNATTTWGRPRVGLNPTTADDVGRALYRGPGVPRRVWEFR